MAVLEMLHITTTLARRPVQLHHLVPLAAGRFESWVALRDHAVAFGRGSGHDEPFIQVDDVSTSRRHGQFAPHDGGWALIDLRSTGGTFVNDFRQQCDFPPYRLADGDVVHLGAPGAGVSARFHAADPDTVAADPIERGLLEAIRQGAAGSEEVYLDWLEQHGLDDRAELLRLERMTDEHPQLLLRYRDLARAIDPGWRVRLLLARGRA